MKKTLAGLKRFKESKKPKECEGGYVYMPKKNYDELINALQECKDYFDYMGGENHVASRKARDMVNKTLSERII